MKRQQRCPAQPGDRGAVAVEFALLLPLLLLLVFGIIDFGRMLNMQITLTQAAREGSRMASLGDTQAQITQRIDQAATSLDPAQLTITATTCPASAGYGQVVVTFPFTFATPVGSIASMIGGAGFGSGITLTGQGEMPCET